MTGKQVDKLAGDRGYRGIKQIGKTKILIPDVPKAKDSYYQKKKKHKLFCKRAGIEPTIGHLKADHRLSRNFYKGVKGYIQFLGNDYIVGSKTIYYYSTAYNNT